MPFCQQPPGKLLFFRIGHLRRVRAGVDSLNFAWRAGFAAHRDRHSVLVPDVGELLARPEYREINRPALIGITHDRGLRPAVWPDGGNRHYPVRVQDLDCWLKHSKLLHAVRHTMHQLAQRDSRECSLEAVPIPPAAQRRPAEAEGIGPAISFKMTETSRVELLEVAIGVANIGPTYSVTSASVIT
jgi:hypothetical protein